MRYIVDRFEGDYAICQDDDENQHFITRVLLPFELREGDVLLLRDGQYSIDTQATEDRKNKIKKMMDKLWD